MGLFTYRQTKKTKQQVKGLRSDQAAQTRLQAAQAARQAAATRETELFQQLSPDGKTEFRAVQAEYAALPRVKKHLGIFYNLDTVRARTAAEAAAKDAVFRKYDLIP
jgi:hypothetical protein